MTCTYTGARVYFDDYGAMAPADLHEVAGATIIRWVPQGWRYGADPDDPQITHHVRIGLHGFHRPDMGMTVVESANVTHVIRSEAVTP